MLIFFYGLIISKMILIILLVGNIDRWKFSPFCKESMLAVSQLFPLLVDWLLSFCVIFVIIDNI